MVLTVEAGVLISAITVLATLGGKWLSSRLKETRDDIIRDETQKNDKRLLDLQLKQINENHTELKRRFDDYEKEHR